MRFVLALLLLPSGPWAAAAAVAVSTAPADMDASLFSRCRDGALDVDALLEDRRALAAAAAGSLPELPEYLACRGLAAARPSCPALDGLRERSEEAGACRDLEWEAKFLAAGLRGGDAAALCRGRFAGLPPDRAAAACATIADAARARSADDVCAAYLAAGLGSEKDSANCRKRMSYLSGKPESCGALADPSQRARCRELARLTAGLTDAKACASSPLCGALGRGGAAACAPIKEALSRRVCSEAEAAARRAERQAAEDRKKLKAESEEAARRKAAQEKQARAAARRKPQFREGQAMKSDPSVSETMKRIGRGEKVEPAKPKGGEKSGGADEDKDGN